MPTAILNRLTAPQRSRRADHPSGREPAFKRLGLVARLPIAALRMVMRAPPLKRGLWLRRPAR